MSLQAKWKNIENKSDWNLKNLVVSLIKVLFSKVVRQDILMFGLARTLRIIQLTMQERLAGRKSLVS